MNRILPYVIMFAMALFIGYQFQCRTELIDMHESNVIAYKDSITRTIDKYDRTVEEKTSYVIRYDNLKNENDSLKNAIKGIKSEVIVTYKSRTEYDTVYIKYKKPLNEKFTIPFTYKKQWLIICGISSNTGLELNKIYVPNKQTIVVGMKQNGWFKESSPCIRVVNSNPYVTGSNLKGIIIKPEKNFIQRNKFWIGLGAGIVTGFMILK